MSWTENEKELFIKLYPYYTTRYLLQHYFPNKKRHNLANMAHRLGIKKQYKARRYDKDTMLLQLKELANKIGRTPLYDELSENGLPSFQSYYRYFGSYKDACVQAGLQPIECLFGKSKHCMIADDIVCLSEKEYIITNFLLKHNIPFEKEKKYSDIINDDRCGQKRCDWYINGDIVEYFGMPDKQYYMKRIQEKRQICNDNNVTLVEIYENDINNLEEIFSKYYKDS